MSSRITSRSRSFLALALCAAGLSIGLFAVAGTPPALLRANNRPSVELSPGTDGTQGWSIVTSPNTSATETNILNAVTCVSSTDCWAVGGYFTGTVYRTLVQHWNGNSWTIVSSPNTTSTDFNNLFGVACASSTECWAVGYGTAFQTLILRWDGASWSIVPTPNAGTRQNILNGVTCNAANDCWAVGFYNAGPNKVGAFSYPTLVLHWNGFNWSVTPSQNTRTQQNILYGVTCTAASNCWAVGYSAVEDMSLPAQTLIEQWDGVSWKIMPSANVASNRNNYLFAIDCISASECRAAGYTNTSGTDAQTLVESWNGTAWSIEPSANPAASGNNVFFGLGCIGPSNCLAVGYTSGASMPQTLTERRDGNGWTVTPSPNSDPSQQNVLNAATCTPGGDCWAVGYYNTASGISQTLIEHFVASAAPIITAVSRGGDGRFIIDGEAVPLATVQIVASSNLVSAFLSIGTTTANSSGVFHFEDPSAAGMPRRFYRARYP